MNAKAKSQKTASRGTRKAKAKASGGKSTRKKAATKTHYVRFETLAEDESDPNKLHGGWRETQDEACAATTADGVLLHSSVVRTFYEKHCSDHDDDEPGLWGYEHTGRLR